MLMKKKFFLLVKIIESSVNKDLTNKLDLVNQIYLECMKIKILLISKGKLICQND